MQRKRFDHARQRTRHRGLRARFAICHRWRPVEGRQRDAVTARGVRVRRLGKRRLGCFAGLGHHGRTRTGDGEAAAQCSRRMVFLAVADPSPSSLRAGLRRAGDPDP
jgi:hypothetical protein